MFSCDRSVCFEDFPGIEMRAVFFPQPLFGADLQVFFPLKNSAFSRATNCNNLALTCFAAGTRYVLKIWNFGSADKFC